MSDKCINKGSQEWKDLVNKYGVAVARHITTKNNMDIPTLKEAEDIINILKGKPIQKETSKEPINKPKGTINVYWGQSESETSTKILSNLAPRKFIFEGREYGSVEHAYQSNKNGSFDKVTYDAYVLKGGHGIKISPKLIRSTFDNLQLMEELVVESFKQNSNSDAAKKLLQYENFTHNTNEIIDKAFLKGLKLAQKELLQKENIEEVDTTVTPIVQQDKLKEETKKKVIEGINYYFMNTLFKYGNPESLFSTKSDSDTFNEIWKDSIGKIFGDLKNKHVSSTNEIDKTNTLNTAKLLQKEEIRNELKESYRKYLRSFNIEVESSEEDSIVSKDNAFAKEGHKISLDDNLYAPVKMLIASIAKVDKNNLGLPELVDYDKTKNFIANGLAGTPAKYDLVMAKLKVMAKAKPELNSLITMLGDEIKVGDNPASFRLKTQFLQSFSKNKNTYFLALIKNDGNILIFDSNANKLKDQLKLEWYNNLKDTLINGEFNDNKIEKIKQQFKSLATKFQHDSPGVAYLKKANELGVLYKELGIELSDKNLEDNYEQLYLYYNRILDYGDLKTAADLYTEGKVEGAINDITELESKYTNTVELQSQNSEGETVYGISLNTYLSLVVNEINTYSGDEQALRENLPHLFNVYTENSMILNRILKGKKISLDIIDGLRLESKEGVATKDLEVGDKWVQQINGSLQGFYTYLRAADRSIENGFRIEGGLLVDSKGATIDAMLGYLKDELNTAKAYKSGIGKNIGYYNQVIGKDNKYEEGERLRFFRGIITSINEDIIQKDLNNKTFNADEWIEQNKQSIVSDINSWLNSEVKKVTDDLNTYKVHDKASKELLENYNSVQEAVEISTYNTIVGYIEQTKLFTGDPLFYKTIADFFKRTTMLNGTKKISGTGKDFDNWLNENRKRLDGKPADGKFTSIIFEDNSISSNIENLEMIKIILSNAGNLSLKGDALSAYMEAYRGMDEADAQGYITLDEYRELMSRAGDWTNEHEQVYQQEQAFYKEVFVNKNLDYINTYKPNYDFLIQPLKTQHFGPMANQELYVPTGYKHSLFPLLPSVVYNRTSGSLLEHMVNNKVGIAQYRSANKFGTIVKDNKKANVLYNADGSFNSEGIITQDTFYKYIGIQLDIAPKIKKEITASTQDRKLNLSNLYKDGKILNPELESIVKEYHTIQNTLINKGLKKILDELGIKAITDTNGNVVDYSTEDRTKFTNYIKKSAESRNNPDNVIQAIERLKNKDVVIDSLLHRNKVINLLNALIESETIREKRFGGSKPQVSSTLMESKNSRKNIKVSNYLKFYKVSKRTGNTLPMEIELSIPKEWKHWVDKFGGLDKFNEAVSETNRLFNEYHSTKEGTEPKYPIDPKLLMLKGFRIPNQGLNSTDAAIVVKYLPYISGDALIVPSEMVAKSGSDFDIDKFNLYFPHYRLLEDDGVDVISKVNEKIKDRKYTYDSIMYIEDMDPSDRTTLDQKVLDIYNTEVKKASHIIYDNYVKESPTTEQLQNRLLELQLELVTHKDNARQLLAPISDYIVKNKMLGLIDSLTGYSANETITDIISPSNVMKKFLNFLAGKAGVGQTAVHLTNHTLSQQVGMFINNLNPSLFFEYNKNEEGYPSLAHITDVKGNMISETLSAFLNAYVDIAKDPYIFRLNAGTKTANTIFYLLRLGADPVWVARFMNQPSIKEYVLEQSIDESEILDGQVTKNDRINKLFNKYTNKFVKGNEDSLYKLSGKLHDNNVLGLESLKLSKLVEERKELYNKTPLLDELLDREIKSKTGTNDTQALVLDQFLEYQRQATLFQEMVRATSPDTKGLGKGVSSVKSLLELQEKVKQDDFIGNVDKVFTDTFIGSFNNIVVETNKLYKEYLISELPQFSKHLRGIQNKYDRITLGTSRKEKIADIIHDDFIMYLIASTTSTNGNKVDNIGISYTTESKLFNGNNSLPKQILSIKKGNSKLSLLLKDNPIIKEFISLLEDDREHNLKIFSRKLNTHSQNVLTEAFREIYEVSPELGDKLTKFALIQSGLNNSPITFVKYIPEDKYFDIVQKVINFVKENPTKVDMNSFEQQFELQNFNFNPILKSKMNNNSGYWEDENIKEDSNKGDFLYIRKMREDKKTNKWITSIYKRSDYPNNGSYSYKPLGEYYNTYLTPKKYSNVTDENQFIKQQNYC